jgi:2-hydroxychromene-2-carboxylate isomerase
VPATLFYDVGSPFAYLAVERAERVLGEAPELQPVLLGGIFRATGRSSWARGDEARRETGMADIERRASAYGLPPIRWPDPWPGDYLFAMRVATHAHRIGCGETFARAAMRLAFAEGKDLSTPEAVIAAADEAGLGPLTTRAAAASPEVKHALRAATDAAIARGVTGVPTVAVGDELFWGDDRLEDAARALRG